MSRCCRETLLRNTSAGFTACGLRFALSEVSVNIGAIVCAFGIVLPRCGFDVLERDLGLALLAARTRIHWAH